MSGADKFLTVNDLRLHYVEHGDSSNPALVCIHGIGLLGRVWDLFASQVSDRYHVLAPTARGHGDSDRADDYQGTVMVEDVAGFLDATASAPATVCGHSMGGAISLGLAALHPDKVAKLIVVDFGPGPAEFGQTLRESMISAPDSYDTIDEAMEEWKRTPGIGISESDPREIRRLVELNMQRGPDGKLRWKTDPNLLETLLGLGQPEAPSDGGTEDIMWAACAAVHCPTLVVRGSRSTALTRECAERMLETIPDAQLVEVDAEHMIMQENPGGFYEAVGAFI